MRLYGLTVSQVITPIAAWPLQPRQCLAYGGAFHFVCAGGPTSTWFVLVFPISCRAQQQEGAAAGGSNDGTTSGSSPHVQVRQA